MKKNYKNPKVESVAVMTAMHVCDGSAVGSNTQVTSTDNIVTGGGSSGNPLPGPGGNGDL